MVELSALVRPSLVFVGIPGADAPTVLKSFAERLCSQGVASDDELLYQRLWEREQLGSTAIGAGVAIPHCKLDELAEPVVAVGVCSHPVAFGADDKVDVQLLFLLVSPTSSPADHLHALAAISRWVKSYGATDELCKLAEPDAIYKILRRAPATVANAGR